MKQLKRKQKNKRVDLLECYRYIRRSFIRKHVSRQRVIRAGEKVIRAGIGQDF